ncbi:MAG: aminotransferase class V-fold PLP-dependent enzyme [Polynucleobacter sp.]|jgi:alanine-glyoxylate transaminase/serine-glyoxylate transaminase/serine-pyruvate transaminase|uniref:pyridoxal-phosphate-dependent aminotransferase family protein n=1 Tax=Polynucleobacter sp. TaxID=2029855 RepID=UPI002173BC55|nr:aminotransferase class V-fold PLP-dependent enzyme [Polynucleobacter sp.]MBU3669726.1 aminotransferase class V-fold PLP-dependent enzyme [Polynucleobacter sp.]MCW1965178.1 aminotransferase class V-fold PLP-dependent enzyme [Polynucleobacter sp.]
MLKLDNHPSGRHFLHIPGPSPVPSRILRAISYQTIDHRGPEFGAFGLKVLDGIKKIFKTEQPVIIYSASGTGSWEGALVNVLNPGDKVLFYETGQFANLWRALAQRLGLNVEVVGKPGKDSWRWGVDAAVIEERLRKDTQHEIKAVCVVHNETSTGVTSNIAAVRKAIDAAKHPALLLVDSVSGLGSADFEHDKWGVDVTVSGSQKGLMLPPGIGFNALSPKAIEASKRSTFPKSYWAWDEILESNKNGYWPTTPSTNLMYGLHEALDMMMAEGLDNIFARHQRLAAACRAAVNAWGLEIQCQDQDCYSPVLTCIATPEGMDADVLRKHALEKFNLSLGTGLGKIKGKAFRIGHLGDCNELSLMAALSGVEMSLGSMGYKPKASGVLAAQESLK